MSETGHDLHHAFPADAAILHDLKVGNAHFQQIAARHHELAREIGRIEGGLENASDARLEELKKQRLAVLDEVAGLIAERRAAV